MANQPLSSYLDYLPAYLQTDPVLGQFLLAFERVLSGLPDQEPPFHPQIISNESGSEYGLETIISQIHTYLDPQQTPAEFLPWLAGWVALSLGEDWDEAVKRQFISQIVPLYRIRGTLRGLKKMLSIYLEHSGLSYPDRKIAIFEFDDRPHYFQVQLVLPSNQVLQPDRYWRECRAAQGIINQEKPAHTFYALRILSLTMHLTQGWGCCYPFTLFDQPPQQAVQIEATVTLSEDFEPQQAEQILIRIQGKTQPLEPNGSQMGPVVRQTVFYDQLMGNPDGFFMALANLGDRTVTGMLTVKLHFNLNQQHFSHSIVESSFDLKPNLRIYKPLNQLEQMPGNTRLGASVQDTLRVQSEPPLTIYKAQIQPSDGNTRLGSEKGQTMRLVHDARLRVYLPRLLWEQMPGNTRLGSSLDNTLRLPRNSQAQPLQIYTPKVEYKIGNTYLPRVEERVSPPSSNSQWLERLYRFRLFGPPDPRTMEIEVNVEPQVSDPVERGQINHLLVVRMQSQTSSFRPFTPELEFLPWGLRATHSLAYQRFLANPRGFFVVLKNISDRAVMGKVTIKLNFKLNQKPISLEILAEDFHLDARSHALEICQTQANGNITGNTVIGRLTPAMLEAMTPTEEAWID
ncbi:phage tail protein [Spirulina sp. CS-785/01]|uniref:phage tail protein n=1 Tax=Spirulina sp. CS-785/01 TaxID=3021716 RepID=UPI00232CC03E|nr:phage tail protein [Spirulina sp. CS-785/01]MDB9315303.1 phage tail protein [Spirulina sp. CS-785/01]